jgi:hypothetical protein
LQGRIKLVNVSGFLVNNMLMIASPGTGKTMLARRLPTVLPSLTPGGKPGDDPHLQRPGPAEARRAADGDAAVPRAAPHD